MTSLPVSVAFSLSLVLGFAAAGTAMPPTIEAQAGPKPRLCDAVEGMRSGAACLQLAASSKSGRRDLSDCHRSIQTHRINGVMVKHRHVGPDCAIRIVGTSS